MNTTDFPIDPQLIAAVEAAFLHTFTAVPDAWIAAAPKRRQSLDKAKRVRKLVALKKRDGRRCFYCHLRLCSYRPATFDHLLPRSLVPGWSVKNLVLACSECNEAKGSQVHAVLMPMLAALVMNQLRLNAGPVERSLVLKAVA
ncbi:HNH endonuclease [Streptomyces sp. NPDC002403]